MATDAEIRAAGLYAVPDRRFLQNEFQLPTNTPTEEVTGSFGIPYTNAFTEGGGGGGQGGGKFGNQDMSDMKEFTIDGKTVEGFRNIASGMYQDKDGLNIQNLGINSFGMAGILEKAFGLKDEKPKYPGYFTDNKFGTLLKNPGTFKKYYAKQDKAKQDKIVDRKNLMANTKKDKSTGTGQNDYQAPTIRSSKNKGFTTSSGMHGGKHYADGGRARYFFGGRVNYKVGGVVHPDGRKGFFKGAQADTSKGESMSPGTDASGGFRGGDNNDGGVTKPTFYDNGIQVITDQSKLGLNYPIGLTKNLGVGQLTAILNARKSLEEEKPEFMIKYDSSLGPINTRTTYDTTTGPEVNANYIRDNFDVGVNSRTGLSGGYSKEIGPGTFTLGGNLRTDGTYDTEGKYVISYANGGLAGLL